MKTRTLRYGVIGTGMMGVEHINNIQALDAAEVVALCDPDEGSLATATKIVTDANPGASPDCFGDHRELLASGGCDALIVASPNMTHIDILLDVIAASVPVLVEKPLCTTVADCQRVVDAVNAQTSAQGAQPLVWVGLEYRYMPAIAQLIEQVSEGVVGEVQMVSIREHRFPFLAKVNDWNRFNANTGGTMVEKCCHFFDLMGLITNANPTRVMASGGQDVNHLEELYDGHTPDILDNAFVVVEFDSGARALLDLCMFAEATKNQEEISVVGNLGKAEALIPDSVVRTGIRGKHSIGDVEESFAENPEIRYQGHHHGSSYVEHQRFNAAVRGLADGDSPEGSNESSPAAGLLSVALGVAAQMSIAEQRIVEMHEVLRT